MNVEQIIQHAFDHGVLVETKVYKDGTHSVVAQDGQSRHRRKAKRLRDALEQALCLVSFEWEDLDRAVAFRLAIPGTQEAP